MNSTGQSAKAGLPPGTLVHIGIKKNDNPRIEVLDFSSSKGEMIKLEKIEDTYPFKSKRTKSWININGLHDVQVVQGICEHFGIDPLVQEDILNTKHRPKADSFDEYVFFTLKMLGVSKDGKSILSEQVSFVLGKSWMITFQEKDGDFFDSIRERIQAGNSLFNEKNIDYLFYRCIDTIVDNYYHVNEFFTDVLESLEEKILKSTDQDQLREIQRRKRMIRNFRKSVVPVREAIATLMKDSSDRFDKSLTRFFDDVYEHCVQIVETIENLRENLGGIMELYHSEVANKMNRVMQLLTIISTIFVPLTFLAGIYGMNFEYMPELSWKYSYPTFWGLMLVLIFFLIFFFKKKRWL